MRLQKVRSSITGIGYMKLCTESEILERVLKHKVVQDLVCLGRKRLNSGHY